MSQSNAVVYPLPSIIAERIFAGRDVFVKYTPRESTKLKPGAKLLIYNSKAIIGEAVINLIEFLTPKETLTKYGQRLMLDTQELTDYINMRARPSEKKLLVLILTHVRKFKKALPIRRAVTMNGLIMTGHEYKRLLKGAQIV